ncbi:ABC transporter ATP-binding protein [Streptomyces sp. CB02923]|uniref:ATP-binding cassette domain-containing protein n=1 Tax=Streptomyces sp. CB02923 TaxID=1718985 RepID=UPI000938ACA3|nr:ATP-binding cassette domain-containing protein [Streptomyces sp. CB02923]OKI05210.1 ABC transporter ATP-binding protein [Streptomyces sp. CB02923]
MHSTPHGAAVTATGYGLEGPRGWAFRDVGLTAQPGSLIAVEGPSGSGRTCLLLALTGRMAATAGTAEVAGLPLPKKKAAVRAVTALAHVPGVTDLEPALTVAEHLRERALLQRRFGDSLPAAAGGALSALLRPRRERTAAARARTDAALEAAGLDLATLPKGDRTSVRDLERPQALRLSIALALFGRPRLLAVDDTDMKLSDAERADVWATLRALAESGTTVLAVCNQAPDGAVVARTAPRTGEEGPAAGRDGQGGSDDGKGAADALAEAGRA